MKPRNFSMIGTLSAFVAAGALLISSAAPAVSAEAETDEDVRILTRGPVHEAFAESVSSQPEPGLIVTTAPPAAIEEMPPDQQPEGENVTWISGYWAWDDEQDDFLWISGIWRNLPPGRQWVPGYWSATDDGRHQWTSGYWADSETTEVNYLSAAPPRTLDVGPNLEAPSEDHTWIPGNWMWVDTRYAWRPGIWTPLRENWTWVPSRYCWSPRGYIYVDGYWDYAIGHRGVLFAPVHFRRHLYAEPDYYYTPSVVVSLDVFTDHLFVRPRWGHYYFGDYYASSYISLGFFSSHRWHSRRGCFDPIYAHQRWHHRHDRNWDRGRQDHFNFFRDNEDARPRHDWAAMRSFRGDRFSNDDRGRSRQFASSLADVARNPAAGQRFRTLDNDRRSELVAQRQEVRNFSQERRQIESRRVAPADRSTEVARREKLSRSPVVGREPARFASGEAPPTRPEARGTNVRENPPGKGRRQAGVAPGEGLTPGTGRQATPAERKTERGPTARVQPGRDREATIPGAVRHHDPRKPQARQLPRRTADAVPEPARQRQAAPDLPDRRSEGTRQRPAQPTPQVRQAPQREPQATRQRQAQPLGQSRLTPQRPVQTVPERQLQSRQQPRAASERRQQASPQRQSQARPQARPAPQRQSQPRAQARQAFQRNAQSASPRQSQARPQVRQAPQRQAPQRQAQSAQRQVQPRSQPRPAPQGQKRRKNDRSDA